MPRNQVGHFYFEWYPTIFKADTQHLTLGEDGAYRRLIDHYMETRAPLPAEDKALARIIGVGWSEWEDVKPAVVKFFKPSTNPSGFLIHTFCDEMLARHEARITTAKNNGKNGGRPKGSKNKDNNPGGFQSETQQKPACSVLLDIKDTGKKEVKKEDSPPTPQGLEAKLNALRSPDQINDFTAYCKEHGIVVDLRLELEKFTQYCLSGKGKYTNHRAAFRNWLLKRKEGVYATTSGNHAASPAGSKTDRAKAAIQRAAESGGFAPGSARQGETGGDAVSELPIA